MSDLDIKFKITGDSKEAQDALGKTSEAVENLGDESKKASHGVDDATISVDELTESADIASLSLAKLSDVTGKMKELGDSFKSVGGEIKSLGSKLTVVTAPLTLIAGLGFKNIYDLGNSITANEGPFKSFAENIKTLKDNFTELTIEVSTRLLPYVDRLINAANNIIAYFRRLDDSTKNLLITIGGIAVALGPALVLVGSLTETFGRLLTLGKPLVAVFTAIGGALTAKIAIIGSAIAGVAGLVNIFLKLKEAGVDTVDAIKEALNLMVTFFIKYVAGNILKAISKIVAGLSHLASFASKGIADSLKSVSDEIAGFADMAAEPFDQAKKNIDTKLAEIGTSAGEAFTFGLSTKISDLKDSFAGMFETPDLSDLTTENAERLDSLKAGYDSLKVTVDDVNRHIEQSMTSTLTDGIMSLVNGTKTLEEAFKEMTQKIVQDLIRIMIQAQITNAVAGSLGAPSTGGGGIFSMFATGGYVSGPGSSMSDSIPARLSNGEYVIRASAVKRVGVGFLDYINNLGTRSFKKRVEGSFADGGSVSGGGQGNINVEIINNGTGKEAADVNFDAERMVVSVILNDLSRNGSVSKAIGSTFGVKRGGFR